MKTVEYFFYTIRHYERGTSEVISYKLLYEIVSTKIFVMTGVLLSSFLTLLRHNFIDINFNKLFIILFFCVTNSKAQLNVPFLEHLQTNQLVNEGELYLINLKNNNPQNDTINYYLAKHFLALKNDSLFFNYFENCKSFYLNDTATTRYTQLYFLKHANSKLQDKWFFANNAYSTNNNQINTFITNLYIHTPTINNSPLLNERLNTNLKKYQKINGKKPFVAALLSSVVPGLGKFYGSRPREGFVTLYSQAIYGIQAYESIKKYGLKNGFSVFSMSFFGLFYVSNIYGSYTGLKDLKKQKKKQLLLDAEKYIHINYPVR